VSAKLIVFAGPACTGKSELAGRLGATLGVPHLTMDATRARILPDSPHTRADRRVAYRVMHFAAGLLAAAGQTVILDAPYGHIEDRRDLAASVSAPFYLVECRVDREIAVRRFRARGADPVRLDLTEERVAELNAAFPYWGGGLLLDTGEATPEACLARIVRYLEEGEPARLEEWAR
jgi:predicted kinase